MSLWRTARVGYNSFQLLFLSFAFWMGILLVVVVGLKVIFPSLTHSRELDQSEILRQIDAGNIQHAHFIRSKDSATVEGEIRNPPEQFKTTIPNREIEELRTRLRNKDVSTTVADEIPRGSLGYYGVWAQTIIVFAVFFFVIRLQMKRLKSKALEFKEKVSG